MGSSVYRPSRTLSTANNDQITLSVIVPEVEIQSLHVCNNSEAIGKSLGELKINKIDGLTLLAISRAGEVKSKPDKKFVLEENDILFFLGQANKLTDIYDTFRDCDSGTQA